MEKQINLFQAEEKQKSEIWYSIQEERRIEIEKSFATLLIRYLCKSIEEASEDEN